MAFEMFVVVFLALSAMLYVGFGFKIVHEGYVIQKYFLGKPVSVKKSGLRFILPLLMTFEVAESKVKTITIEKEEILTQDEIPLVIGITAYYRLSNPAKFKQVENVEEAVKKLIQGLIREELGQKPLTKFTSDLRKTLYAFKVVVQTNAKEFGINVFDIKLVQTKLTKKVKKHLKNKDIENKIKNQVETTKNKESTREEDEESDFLLD